MSAHFKRAFLFFREVLYGRFDDLELILVYALHKAFVEASKPGFGVSGFDIVVNALVAANVNFVAADDPQNRLYDTLRHAVVLFFVSASENIVRVNVLISVVALYADFKRLGVSRLFHFLSVRPEFKVHRTESLIKRWYKLHTFSPVRLSYVYYKPVCRN